VVRMICSVAVLSMTLVTKLAAANEVEGFRLGMSMQQVSQLVLEKGYKLSNPVKSGQNWTSYLLMKDGPNLSFCGNVLSWSANHTKAICTSLPTC
jgi:hypothetical protein